MDKEDIIEQYPEVYIKYHAGIDKLKNLQYKPVQRDIRVYVLIGPPGCGKTRHVYDGHDINDIYKLNTNSNGTLWFDGYTNQTVLLIDDFKGWIKYTDLLTILDRYPYRCQIKGGYVWAKWTIVYITSNYKINEWYNNEIDRQALKR